MVIRLAVIAALGAHALAVLVFEVLLNATAMFDSSNVRLPTRIDHVLRRLVVTRARGMKSGRSILPFALAMLALGPLAADAQDAEPVRIERDGLKLEMAPLGSDPVRAFFLARGFATGDVQHIVDTACLFRSAIGSAGTAAGSPEVTVALSEWRVMPTGGAASAPRSREAWEAIWKARGVPEDAATAFYWALFPTEQTFYPTDYNWGFLPFGLAPGTSFDLTLVWRTGGTSHTNTIKGLRCAF